MATVLIRHAQVDDIPAIRRIADRTWRKTYGHIFDAAFIDAYLAEGYSVANLQHSIESAQHCFLVAHLGAPATDTAIGYAHAAPTQDEWEAQLFRIYLLSEHWGKGIGSQLLDAVETWLWTRQITSYRCFVHKDNSVGIDFYRCKGFEHKPEADKDDERCMRRTISVER